jgi:pyrimidine operon attenuation protein/uracil phosphoribosyltransferase
MIILHEQQIRHKIKRLAIEVLERRMDDSALVLAGLNNKGLVFAGLLLEALEGLKSEALRVTLTRIRLNPADPTAYDPVVEGGVEGLVDKSVLIVDDVSNTGRTLFYAVKPLLGVLPRRVEVAVLVDRKHKLFPIQPDYVGLSLYTTLKDNIEVTLEGPSLSVHLE